MPLLMCPNDNASMQTLKRDGVEFDMCPTCRGVWLDRGELEKLIDGARTAMSAEAPPPPQWQRSRHEYGEHGERGEYGGSSHGPRQRRRGFDLFDIFD